MSAIVLLRDDASDSSSLTVASTGDNISDFRFADEQLVQTVQALRAASADHLNRLNFSGRVTLQIKYAPAATALAAKQAAVALIIAVRAKLATATVLDVTFNGIVFRLSKLALPTWDIVASGSTAVATFNFLCGTIAEVAP